MSIVSFLVSECRSTQALAPTTVYIFADNIPADPIAPHPVAPRFDAAACALTSLSKDAVMVSGCCISARSDTTGDDIDRIVVEDEYMLAFVQDQVANNFLLTRACAQRVLVFTLGTMDADVAL